MSFDLRHKGKSILKIDEQVTGVRLQTARGETAVTGIAPHEGVIDIIIDSVAPGGPKRLDEVEAEVWEEIRERSPEGTIVGHNRNDQVVADGAKGTQEEGESPRPPSRDLAEGLDPSDTEALTARLNAFGKDGDADKAIKDNPASGKAVTAEQGATPGSDDDADSESGPSTGSSSESGSSKSKSGSKADAGAGIKL